MQPNPLNPPSCWQEVHLLLSIYPLTNLHLSLTEDVMMSMMKWEGKGVDKTNPVYDISGLVTSSIIRGLAIGEKIKIV